MAWFKRKDKTTLAVAETEKDKVQPVPGADDGNELIAVLSAAVAVMLGSEKFVIRSYKRVSPSAWKNKGRDFQIFGH